MLFQSLKTCDIQPRTWFKRNALLLPSITLGTQAPRFTTRNPFTTLWAYVDKSNVTALTEAEYKDLCRTTLVSVASKFSNKKVDIIDAVYDMNVGELFDMIWPTIREGVSLAQALHNVTQVGSWRTPMECGVPQLEELPPEWEPHEFALPTDAHNYTDDELLCRILLSGFFRIPVGAATLRFMLAQLRPALHDFHKVIFE